MKNLCDLLFELSSEERLNIIQSLQEEEMKLSHLAQKLDMTVTETSRHLQRLSEADLIVRSSDGLYNLTSFGDLTLFLLPSLKFVSLNRKYFLDHNITSLPLEFRNRISELSDSTFSADTVIVFGEAREMLMNAEEFIWLQSYQHLMWNAPIVSEKIEQGLDFRFILPSVLDEPENYEAEDIIMRRTKTLESVDARILLTEKGASLSFPYNDGRIDYAAFMSTDSVFCKWCSDLFQYYWDKAR